MRVVRWLLGGLLVALVLGAALVCGLWPADAALTWRTAPVVRKDIVTKVSATGTLEPVLKVEVGTQVSGIVSELLVDFNESVEAGQVIARIDTALLEADVAASRARVAQGQAQLQRAELSLARATQLRGSVAGTEAEYELARADRDVAKATLDAAQVDLRRATRNLGYATIQAPISGTVVERAVEVGQTVNAGLAAPKLFLLAGDLNALRILVAVDEADISRLREGMRVEFAVQGYPDRTFAGVVEQVRLQSTLLESVVTYTVVVQVDNSDRALLPGMTATVDFVVSEAFNALCVPNGALRYRPPAEAVAGASDVPARGGRGGAERTIYRVAAGGKVTPLAVKTGMTDNICTEVFSDALEAGVEVVVGATSARAGSSSSSPFGTSGGSSRRGRGGF